MSFCRCGFGLALLGGAGLVPGLGLGVFGGVFGLGRFYLLLVLEVLSFSGRHSGDARSVTGGSRVADRMP